MVYTTIAALISTHEEVLSKQLAQALVDQKLLPAETPFDAVVKYQTLWLDRITHYLNEGDVEAVREQIQRAVYEQIEGGMTVQCLQATNLIFYDGIKDFIQRELTAAADAATRQKFIRRVDSIKSLSSVIISATSVQQRDRAN